MAEACSAEQMTWEIYRKELDDKHLEQVMPEGFADDSDVSGVQSPEDDHVQQLLATHFTPVTGLEGTILRMQREREEEQARAGREAQVAAYRDAAAAMTQQVLDAEMERARADSKDLGQRLGRMLNDFVFKVSCFANCQRAMLLEKAIDAKNLMEVINLLKQFAARSLSCEGNSVSSCAAAVRVRLETWQIDKVWQIDWDLIKKLVFGSVTERDRDVLNRLLEFSDDLQKRDANLFLFLDSHIMSNHRLALRNKLFYCLAIARGADPWVLDDLVEQAESLRDFRYDRRDNKLKFKADNGAGRYRSFSLTPPQEATNLL